MAFNFRLRTPEPWEEEAHEGISSFHEFGFYKNILETSSAFVDSKNQIRLSLTDTTELSQKYEPNEFLLQKGPIDCKEQMESEEGNLSDVNSDSMIPDSTSVSELNHLVGELQIEPENIEQRFTQIPCPIQVPGEEPSSIHTYDPAAFLEYFDLKYENVRQTAIRRFKATMKKAYSIFKKWESSNGSGFLRIMKHFKSLYCVDTPAQDSETIFESMCSLFRDVDADLFEAKYNTNSCNDRYVQFLFAQTNIKELYKLHVSMARNGKLYFDKFSQFKDKTLTSEEKVMIFEFCENLAK